MILCTRVEAREFQMLLSRCVSGRPRGPASFLVIRFAGGKRTSTATTNDGVRLTHTATFEGERDEVLVVPGSILAEVEGSTTEEVKLERQSKLRGVVYWHGGGQPRTLPVELLMPGKLHELSEPPVLAPISATILSALQECGRSAARNNGRYALSRIQIQGKAGRVIGTDGKTALLWHGFPFPFADDVLVPALSVFGSKPLAGQEVRLGRMATHLVVSAGPWTLWLPADGSGRYPDVAGVVPRRSPTGVELDPQDAVELVKWLPTLPGNRDEHRPVTLDVNGTITIRARDSETSHPKDFTLTRSSTAGPPACTAIDRRLLARAISLGCRTLKLTPEKPIVLDGENITFVAAPLDPGSIVPSTHTIPTASEVVPNTTPLPEPERNPVMEPPKMNGHTPLRGDPPDPLVVAEELRDALTEAATKAARLVTALRAGRKEKKVLTSILANLKQLGLDGGGSP
jgi:hypothetical protein